VVSGPVKDLMEAEDVWAITDFTYSPMGNNYFTTSECGSSTIYSATVRGCFNDKCGRDASNRPADCFTGTLVTQHGAQEGEANRYMACAKKFESDPLKYLEFVSCIEDGYGGDSDTLAQSCSKTFDFKDLKACYDGQDGDQAIMAEAMATPVHQGVPWIEVNGKENDDARNSLIKVVCEAYQGTKPAGCSKAIAV